MPEQAPTRSSLLFSHDTLLWLIIPLVIEQLLLMTVGMAGTVMVTTSGEAAVSGVSLAGNINTLIIQVSSTLSTGGAVVISQYLGQQDTDNAKAASKQLLYTMYALSLLLMGVALVLRQHTLALIPGHMKADVIENTLVYFLLTVTAYPFMGIYNIEAALFRAMDNSKVSMFYSLVVNVISVAVSAVLIFGFGVGATGTGIGTLVSRIAATVTIVALLNHPDHVFRVEGLLHFEFRGAIVKHILFIGILSDMENGMFQTGKLMVLNLITTFGTPAVAANAIASSTAGVTNVPGMALGLAIITVVGQCTRAGETGQAVYYTRRFAEVSYLYILVISAALFFSAEGLVTLFHLDPEACVMAVQVLRARAVGSVLFQPLAFTLPNSLQAAGDTIFAMAVFLGSMFVCQVVLSYVFTCAWDLNLRLLGIWFTVIAGWMVWTAFFLFRYWRGRWKHIRVI